MLSRRILIAGLFLVSAAMSAAPSRTMPARPAAAMSDGPSLGKHLHGLGHKTRGGVDKKKSAKDKSFPQFSSSFSVNGATYPFTMIGYPPESGRAASIKTILIPLQMNFVFFGPDGDMSVSFDPRPAIVNMSGSPLYKPAAFPNGVGQFCDQMQRAAFWNRMDSKHKWHVYMDDPMVAKPINIEVTPEIGTLQDLGGGNFLGNVPIDFMDSQAQTILELLDLDPDVLPIFVTNGVTAEALGYHTAYEVQNAQGQTSIQTYIYTSWLDPSLVPPIFADVSTFNHELSEWMNDPFVNNIVPDWNYPPSSDSRSVCSGNPYLEVGDPQGNGPTYDDYPAILVKVGGVTYHLQQLVLWQWFTDEVPSSAFGGWYTFPSPGSLEEPAVYCP